MDQHVRHAQRDVAAEHVDISLLKAAFQFLDGKRTQQLPAEISLQLPHLAVVVVSNSVDL